jgi:hypothetical protein
VSSATVGSGQTVTITARYGGTSATATLTVLPPAQAPFSSLTVLVTFQPTGNPSGQFSLVVTPDAGNVTYTASDASGMSFTNGIPSNQNQTFTFNAIQPGAIAGVADFIWGPNSLNASSALLSLTLHPESVGGVLAGTITGTLSVTGTPFPAGGASVTLSGAITGSYFGLL